MTLLRGPAAGRCLAPALVLAAILSLAPRPAAAGNDWIPPQAVSVVFPSATLAHGQPRTLDLMLRANRVPANLTWRISSTGQYALSVTPLQGTVALAANQTAVIPLTLTVPPAVVGTAFVTVRVTYDPPIGGFAASTLAMIRAASGGRPEVIPLPSTYTAQAGTAGAVTFQLRSTIGTSEQFSLTMGRDNPDKPNNNGMLFLGSPPTSPVTLPGGGAVLVSVPTYLPGNSFPGNLNSIQLSATSVSDPLKGVADAKGHAFINAGHPDSLPSSLHPVGLVRQEQTLAGRDGPTLVPGRGLHLLPSGTFGVRVVRDSALSQVGPIDRDTNSVDDRLVGRIRIPAYAASISIVPGFVNGLGEVLDLGLLAAGKAGLMLIDLRDIVDPPIGNWEDFYDLNEDGIDDRILRMLPIQGFATDVEWFWTAEGRLIALVAAADTGSVPVAANYAPGLVISGTGAGVVAIDVAAALDSLPGVPFMAGAVNTPGTALDLELRGGVEPDLAVADGPGGVCFYSVTSLGTPATVSFTPVGTVPLSSAWGAPYARDLAWVPNSADSAYLAVASAAGGVQLVKAPRGGTPFLALAQNTGPQAVGVATTHIGTVAAALGSAGATLLRLPVLPELDQIDPAASPPYQAPVILNVNQTWTEGRALRIGDHGTLASSITSLRFKPFVPEVPDLLCADGSRLMVLRPGAAAAVSVPLPQAVAWTPGLRLLVAPNPVGDRAEFRVLGSTFGFAAPGRGPASFQILDLQGRLVRGLPAEAPSTDSGLLARAVWNGRDESGRPVPPGRYWVRATQRAGWSVRAGFVVLR